LIDRENFIISFQSVILFQLDERVGVWGRGNADFSICSYKRTDCPLNVGILK
jgi:hypothetical protein